MSFQTGPHCAYAQDARHGWNKPRHRPSYWRRIRPAGHGNPTTGRIGLGAGSADILADRVIIGKGQTVSGAASTGFLTMGAGNLDANTMEIAKFRDG